jgi:sec-independent protein translocase protein TatA
MGFGGISLWQLLIVLVIVVLIFGTKRLSSMGGDLGGALKGFRKAMSDADSEDENPKQIDEPDAEFSETHSDEKQTDRNQTS